MDHQAYVGTYRAAMEAATNELEGLFEEAQRLRSRMEQIDSAISALKVLVGTESELSAKVSAPEPGSEVIPMKHQIDSALGLVFA